MSRIKIELPPAWLYSVEIPVRITDINYGHHVGNDSVVAILHDARFRWLQQFGWTELKIGDVGLIMVDLGLRFKAEAGFGDVLRVKLAVSVWNDVGFELVYQVVKVSDGDEVARAESSMVFFDYTKRRLARRPDLFRERVEGSP